MKTVISLLFILICFSVKGEIVKFKFQLFNNKDSSEVKINSVILRPIKSYQVEEIEHHGSGRKKYNFKSYKIIYDTLLGCNVFEFDSKEYPFEDIYLRVESDSFYYSRRFESDYDESDCIHFKTNNKNNIYKIYLSSYRYIRIIDDAKLIKTNCYNINVMTLVDGDTIWKVSPKRFKKITQAGKDNNLIKVMALDYKTKYVLMIEIYSEEKYVYSLKNLSKVNEQSQDLYLSSLRFDEYDNVYKEENCVRLSGDQEDKFIEFYRLD